MSKRVAVLSMAYWFSATTLGMLVHPYKTMRKVVRKRALKWSLMTPLVWGVFYWIGAVIIILLARFMGSLWGFSYPVLVYVVLELLFWWVMWFLLSWQVLVGYLYYRFKRVF